MPTPLPAPNPLPIRISEFIQRLKRVRRTLRASHPLVQAEVDALRRDYAPLTLPSCFSKYRLRIMADLGRDHPAANMLLSAPKARAAGLPLEYCCGLTSIEVGANKRRDRRRVIAHQHAQLPINDPIRILHNALALARNPGTFAAGPRIGKPRWPELLLTLILITGRRPVELAMMGTFTKGPKGSNGFTLTFEGQAKTRGAAGTRQGPYPIHLLAPSAFTLRAIALLHASLPRFKTPEHFHNVSAKPVFEAVTKYFQGFSAYDLRAVNGRLTYHLFAPANMTDLAWFQDQFGHTDTITSAFYQRYYLPKPTAWRKAFKTTFQAR